MSEFLLTNSLDRFPLLLVTSSNCNDSVGGRQQLSTLLFNVLRKLFRERLYKYELGRCRPTGIRQNFNALRGHIDGINAVSIGEICSLIQKNNIRRVLIDGSNLGALVSALRHSFDDLEVSVIFHNVEARFFWGGFLASKSFRSFCIFAANFFAERKAACLSDKRICLSERDSRLLKTFYGKSATHISPLALEDMLPLSFYSSPSSVSISNESFALFVGGNFYANRDGIRWFVQHVIPHVDLKICIVGKGMDQLRAELEIPGRVEVVGSVKSLCEWYSRALFVIAPIFDGSGMKTKVAEALMHGKKIVGTPEAFSGYEEVVARAGWCCSSPSEFVNAINEARTSVTCTFDSELRSLYEDHYSVAAVTACLADAFGVTQHSLMNKSQ